MIYSKENYTQVENVNLMGCALSMELCSGLINIYVTPVYLIGLHS